ncbi:MAG: hypothetical protein ACSHW7_06000 [Patiriisocius sp.]|uniref:hypothetical protein n=1 Tax=Patiriisocius sp. TaxID=2822396 RepID=UPI003EF27EE5
MDLLLEKKKISSQSKKLNTRISTPQLTPFGISHINKLINDIQTDIEVVSFEQSLKEDWMKFTHMSATLMNRKSFL